MRGSIKANLIVFLIIATIAFAASLAFASLTIHEDNESYKLVSLDDDSFEPSYIYKVPTIKPKNTTNKTNTTNNTNEDVIKNITEVTTTIDDSNDTNDEIWEDTYEEYDEED